jgi:DNA invertase Pin-like site-specific DNA recombinase
LHQGSQFGIEKGKTMTTKEVKLRAVGYCRTSGEGQRDNTSIPNQRTTIESFCQTNTWKFTKHYVDECKTGSKIEGRDAFQEMLKDAALKRFDMVVCFDVSRFARDGVDILGQAKFLREAFGVHVVDAQGKFDSRPGGNTLLNFVYAGVSEYERLKIMERMIGGRISRAKAGQAWSGKKPFGRDYAKDTGWTVNERGLRIRALLERYAAGQGLTELVKEFTEFSSPEIILCAVKTSQLSGIYVKEFNIADLGIKGLRIPVPAIPEVISPQLEAKVRARMEHCRHWSQRHYLLTGFVRCGHCGHLLSGNRMGRLEYYRHRHPTAKTGCVFHAVPEAALVAPALDYLYSFFTDEPRFNAAVASALPDRSVPARLAKERDAAAKNLAKVEKEIGRFLDAIAKGVDPALLIDKQSELKTAKESHTTRLGELDAQLAALPDPATVAHDAMAIRLALLQQVQERDWRKLSFDAIRQFLIFLFGENPGRSGQGITVTREKGSWRLAFKGRVGFWHEVVNGRPVSRAAKDVAAQHNKAVVAFLGHCSSARVNEFIPGSWKPRPLT